MRDDSEWPSGMPPSGRRLLVIADGAATSERLRNAVGAHVAEAPAGRVLVVAPAGNSRLRHERPASDSARSAAVRRLQACIDRLAEDGIEAEGMIGDANPVQAIDDALRIFPADRVIVAMLPQERSAPGGADVAEQARARFELPTTQLFVDAV
jgi:hypothetical protein